MEQWGSGAVGQWGSGAVGQWSSGAVEQWSSGAVGIGDDGNAISCFAGPNVIFKIMITCPFKSM